MQLPYRMRGLAPAKAKLLSSGHRQDSKTEGAARHAANSDPMRQRGGAAVSGQKPHFDIDQPCRPAASTGRAAARPRRSIAPRAPTPTIIIIQVDGSGTPATGGMANKFLGCRGPTSNLEI